MARPLADPGGEFVDMLMARLHTAERAVDELQREIPAIKRDVEELQRDLPVHVHRVSGRLVKEEPEYSTYALTLGSEKDGDLIITIRSDELRFAQLDWTLQRVRLGRTHLCAHSHTRLAHSHAEPPHADARAHLRACLERGWLVS